MFNFLKKKSGKRDTTPGMAELSRNKTKDEPTSDRAVAHALTNENDVTNETKKHKDVVNLLLPKPENNQKSGVGAFLQIMAGKRKKNKKKTESMRVSPTKEMSIGLQRSKSERDFKRDVATPTRDENTHTHAQDDPADFVRALVLQKYANKTQEKQHVQTDEKRHAEALLREIARSIDCTIEKINENKCQMGAADSKTDKRSEPVYETIQEPNPIDTYKNNLNAELIKLTDKEDVLSIESPSVVKKSNLKPPKSDTEGCSDDDRSECSKKRVTFRKHIVFDDGDEQTDEEIDSSFASLSSEEEEEEYLEDALPDNDELLGGYVVSRNDDKTVLNFNNNDVVVENDKETELKRVSSDNSDSGFIEQNDSEEFISEVKTLESESDSESEVSTSESESEEEIIEIIEEEIITNAEPDVIKHDNGKSLVSQESQFQAQVAALTELSDARSSEAEIARQRVAEARKEIEEKDREIEQLKCDLASAYKESELIRQRGRSLEEDLAAAKEYSRGLQERLAGREDESLIIRQLRAELEDALNQRAELESRVTALERDRDRLEREKQIQEQKAQEAIETAEANTAKWRSAHEAARSQAAARAERMLADCEWKMRDLERRAREADRQKKELSESLEQLKVNSQPSASHVAELQQLKGVISEQQRSVQSLTLQLQKVETREEALKLEVHRLKELLDKETRIGKEKDERHMKTIERLEQSHAKALVSFKSESAAAAAASRATLERAHAERTRNALAQLRAEADQEARNADRKLREVTTRFENLKEVLACKETQFEKAIAEANSKADWNIMQLRHLLDKADISYANNVEKMNERFERETERLAAEWSEKLRLVEEEAATAAVDARKLLEDTRTRLVNERHEQVTKLKEQHRLEMEDQWEQFMTDKEICLTRMKTECTLEGEEERVKREKELLEEIAELKALLQSKSVDYETLEMKTAACGRTLAVTEQELREALEREKDLREKRAEDATKIKQAERSARDQVEHLTRKCACLRKLFDDMRARLATRDQTAEQEARAKDKEIHQLRSEVARLTKLLAHTNTSNLGARTRADGCEMIEPDESYYTKSGPVPNEGPNAPRRKGGGSLRTPEFARKRPTLPDLAPLPPEARRNGFDEQNGRQRSKSVDLPAVQVPVRIKQLQDKLDGPTS